MRGRLGSLQQLAIVLGIFIALLSDYFSAVSAGSAELPFCLKSLLASNIGQCAAEMVAAQKFNQVGGQEVATIYGSVTTGTQWQFLKLTGRDLTIDVTEYALDPSDRILGIFKWMAIESDD